MFPVNKFEYLIVNPGTQTYRDYLALRHTVFREELRRVPDLDQLSGNVRIESDMYDKHSLHVLCRSMETGAAVACARLILPSTAGLSISSRYMISLKTAISPGQIGEIGRLAIASKLRRYRGELSSAGLHHTSNNQSHHSNTTDKHDGPLVALGLYREIFKLARKHGISNCYAAMEPSLARLLARIGFPFQMAGPLNTMVYPPRKPYFIGGNAIRKTMTDIDTCLSQFMFGPSQDESPRAMGTFHPNRTAGSIQTG